MPDTIRLFGTDYQVEDGVVRVSHQMRVEQARQLQALVCEAISLQEAIRMACGQAISERKELETRSDFDEAVAALQRIDRRLAETHDTE